MADTDSKGDPQGRSSAIISLFLQPSPKYWLLGLAILLLSAISHLPYRILLSLGRAIGAMIYRSGGRVKHIANVNITRCYPSLAPEAQQRILQQSFRELGISVVETFRVWFGDAEKFYGSRTKLEGEDHWRAALARERGIILLSCHYGSLDLNATLAGLQVRKYRKYAFTYRKPSDQLVDRFLVEKRTPYADHFFPVNNLVGIIRLLKKQGVVWYAPDIEVKNKNSVFANFMGIPASTTAGLSKLAQAGNAVILPFGHYRNSDNTYTLKFFPPLEGFPSEDAVADTRQINRAIEHIIRPFPERYWWTIKRFKNRPAGEPPFY
ncbi:lysophospholipid acyltransferase family protein [Teredinibacter turnerae]|uniref:Lipid A biosynthesis lauroyl n=1 Tax=Teredinibacter turnerae (strain ATCC 39867 / T7901) TaxID=377629 RepID=C5BNR5_TERTT|nr:lysophospholipid acyltransferase family protein [Teredinibacter turnerae]ACR11954.1 lipid A biosynthesis lauroyl [Teredinibacter turnerae T7901]